VCFLGVEGEKGGLRKEGGLLIAKKMIKKEKKGTEGEERPKNARAIREDLGLRAQGSSPSTPVRDWVPKKRENS